MLHDNTFAQCQTLGGWQCWTTLEKQYFENGKNNSSHNFEKIFSKLSYGGRQPPSRRNFQNREKTFIIEKKLSGSRKKFGNPENYYRVKRKIYEIEKKN